MQIRDLTAREFGRRCARGTARYSVGPFNIQLQSNVDQVGALLHHLYGDFPFIEHDPVIDHRMWVRRPPSWRRWIRRQVSFDATGEVPFPRLPARHAFPLLEWGFNWCVASTAHQYLMLHAGVIEKSGVCVILPALPGAGKSTLCAALSHRGWRLLSDEFALVRPGETQFVPFPRCIPLKNESIDLIRNYAPEAVLGPVFEGTRKGDVAHLKPPSESVRLADRAAPVTHVIFPQYREKAAVSFTPIPKASAFLKVCSNAFNYEIFGAEGFNTVGDIIDTSQCLGMEYSNLDEIVAAFDELTPATGQEDSGRRIA